MLGEHVGELLSGCSWVGVPFAGGMSELPHIRARTIVANDLHRHVINLADVVACPDRGPKLKGYLESLLFHETVLERAQQACLSSESREGDAVEWAAAYFVCCWQGRSSKAGTKGEFNNSLSLRWDAGGGDSAKRYCSAVESLDLWMKEFRRVTFTCMDVFAFLDKCKDRENHGIYCDAPFPGFGAQYQHTMSESQHIALAEQLSDYNAAVVVCRFYDEPLIREFYPESLWKWAHLDGRSQSNAKTPEVLLVRGGDA